MNHFYNLKSPSLKLLQIIFFIGLCLGFQNANAQKKNANIKYYIHKATDVIKVDGVMNEQSWLKAQAVDKFPMVLPMDTSVSNVPTEVRMTFDENNLYS